MPSPPAVEPPACSRSSAALIVALSEPLQLSNTMPEAPAYTTMEMRSVLRRSAASSDSADLTSGSLFGSSMEPETSSRNTRLLSGLSVISSSLALTTTRASARPSFHGQPLMVTFTLTGSLPSGAA